MNHGALPGILLIVAGSLVIYWAALQLGIIVRKGEPTREVIHNPDGSRVVGGSW